MLRSLLFVIGLFILLGVEIGRVFFIMPFPGSQRSETIELAYFLHQYIMYFRILGIIIIAYPAYQLIHHRNIWIKWPVVVLLIFWLMVMYSFNFRMQADKMFYQPKTKTLLSVTDNKVPVQQLILGITRNGESKAYPIEIIGYHHQVRDTVGGDPVMVTYCTVCRTGRVFSPFVNGEAETFRLVGMDHFNAMFEDSKTGSWWRQVNGEAIIGQLKGTNLEELPADQMTLAKWINIHPDTKILQPDSLYIEAYNDLAKYDEGKMKGRLEGRDSVSWGEKSWVVGIQLDKEAKAYDWTELQQVGILNDKLSNSNSVLIALEPDSATFHVWKSPDSLQFTLDNGKNFLVDDKTGSHWNWDGACTEGKLAGSSLEKVQAYQEYWHSWKTFRPGTTQYKID